ncbi:MAG: phosphopantothenoylcysteine decarboxylase [Armatimonadetes bacterium]|jgi:phosphopantothenoylcysteine decarboxylase/phosphopantothenate--cysteine ligase|nr:phosphopantothenoylcysteine decarboxylase [Armatimonadota bacterium]
MNVMVGVTGGIAAYKACELVRLLRRDEHAVRVVMTANAQRFVTSLTFEALSNNPVATDMWAEGHQYYVEHIEIAKWADVAAIAPATANFIGKVANGIADDLLTTIVMALPAPTPVVIAPAMNTQMWLNPIVQRNIEYLRSLGKYQFVLPRVAKLACGDTGAGALAAPEEIVRQVLARAGDASSNGACPA